MKSLIAHTLLAVPFALLSLGTPGCSQGPSSPSSPMVVGSAPSVALPSPLEPPVATSKLAPVAAPMGAAETVTPAPDTKTLPDGVFSGGLTSDDVSGDVRLVIRGGMIVSAEVDAIRKTRYEFKLQPRGPADATELSLTGRNDPDYLSMLGVFLDGERAAGTFKGNVGRKVVSGRWYAIRR